MGSRGFPPSAGRAGVPRRTCPRPPWREIRGYCSVLAAGSEQLAGRLSVVDEADRPAVGGLELVLGVDAQLEIKDSRQVGRSDRALGRQVATGVGLAQD